MNEKIAFLLNQQINKEFYSAYPNPCCWVLLFLKTSQDSQVESPDF